MSHREMSSIDHYKDTARNSTIALLALEVMKANGKSLPLLTSADGRDHLKPFRAAVLQAETMLRTVENRGDEFIHAYRLFFYRSEEGSAPQSVKEIHGRFVDAGWREGMSENTLRTRIWEILKDVEEEKMRKRDGFLSFLERHNFKEPADEDIDGFVRDFIDDFAIPDAIGDIHQLRSKMAAVIRRMIDKAMAPMLLESGTSESPTDPLTISNFMKFVCGHDTLADAECANSEWRLQLRPYELFLYAHQRDMLTPKLTKLRAKLEQDFDLQPEYSSSLSIMFAHAGAEKALEEWEKEDEERNRRLLDLEKRTEERCALKRQGEVSQQQAALQEAEITPPGKEPAEKALSKKKSTGKKRGKKGGH